MAVLLSCQDSIEILLVYFCVKIVTNYTITVLSAMVNIDHFSRYAHSEKASNRLFSLEVVGRLMYSNNPTAGDNDPEDVNNSVNGDTSMSSGLQENQGENAKKQ